MQCVEFLVGVAQSGRPVADEGLVRINQSEYVRSVEEAHVEGRIFAHERLRRIRPCRRRTNRLRSSGTGRFGLDAARRPGGHVHAAAPART